VEEGITITARRTTSREILRQKASSYRRPDDHMAAEDVPPL